MSKALSCNAATFAKREVQRLVLQQRIRTVRLLECPVDLLVLQPEALQALVSLELGQNLRPGSDDAVSWRLRGLCLIPYTCGMLQKASPTSDRSNSRTLQISKVAFELAAQRRVVQAFYRYLSGSQLVYISRHG